MKTENKKKLIGATKVVASVTLVALLIGAAAPFIGLRFAAGTIPSGSMLKTSGTGGSVVVATASDLAVTDTAENFTTDNVEAALAQNATDIALKANKADDTLTNVTTAGRQGTPRSVTSDEATESFSIADIDILVITGNHAAPAITLTTWESGTKYQSRIIQYIQPAAGNTAPTWAGGTWDKVPWIDPTANSLTEFVIWTRNAGTNVYVIDSTIDATAAGTRLKTYGYLVFANPQVFGPATTQQTTVTTATYGQALFADDVETDNYIEYRCIVPPDLDTAVDLTAVFAFRLGGADTGDHDYVISFDSVAASAAYAGSLGDAISLTYTADASGADGDLELTAETTLTGWKSAMTPGGLLVIRITRDGDDGTNDTSTVDSYSGPLIIKYGSVQ